MTINGPAPMLLAQFLNAAVDQQCERWIDEHGDWDEVDARIDAMYAEVGVLRPRYGGELPPGNDGLGLRLLGTTGDRVLPAEVYAECRERALRSVRGTVQADILKEDQAQNTCIFSTEFALRMMGDIQQKFIDEGVRNFYSVSISGYHIAEAGANPITQLALHAEQRLHVRRVLPRARHGDRRLRAEPVVLLQQRPGPRVRGHRTRRSAHLGEGDQASATAATSAARS